jgi:hypothetical protein
LGAVFIVDSSPSGIVAEMAEGKDTHTAEQEKDADKWLPWWKRLWGWTQVGKKSGWD